MLKKEYLAKMLVVFGITTLISWLVYFICILIPFQFQIAKWVHFLSQEISDKSVFPLIGILAITCGIYVCNAAKEGTNSKCKCAVIATRICSAICIFFFAGLITLFTVHCLSIKSLQNDVKSQIMSEAVRVKSQVAMMIQSNPNYNRASVQKGMQDLDIKVNQEIKKAKKEIIISSIGIHTGLIAYAIAYLIFAVLLIKISSSKKDFCCNTETQS